VFNLEERDRVRSFVLDKARADARIVAAAVVGSFARGTADRWSDLDLTFAVADDVSVGDVLSDWTADMARDLEAVHVLDLEVGPTIYRVFMLPELLQVDLSFTPAARFAPRGPAFQLLFGEAGEPTLRAPRTAEDVFGWGSLHAIHAWRCVERGRPIQALHHIAATREHALHLGCLRRGLDADERSWDRLPEEVRDGVAAALAHSLQPEELLRAVKGAIDFLFHEAGEAGAAAKRLEPEFRALVAPAREPVVPPRGDA
jgi:predicted nucleotidyltransferase